LVKKIKTLDFIIRNNQFIEFSVHLSTFNQYHAKEREQAAEVSSLYDFVNKVQAVARLAYI